MRFNPNQKYTYGQLYRPAKMVQTQEEADTLFNDILQWVMARAEIDDVPLTVEQATATIKNDIGYFAGYYDEETEKRMDRLFGTSHPIFNPGNIDRLDTQKQMWYNIFVNQKPLDKRSK